MAEFKLGRIRFVWKGAWSGSATYYKDDVVNYGGKTFICVIGHNADSDFYTDLENVPARWEQFSDGLSWKGDWSNPTLYKINDIVNYGGYVYICNEGHTSQTLLEDDLAKWDVFAESLNWTGDWNTSTVYKINDVVKYGGNNYICNEGHTSASSTTLGLEDDLSKWDLLSEGFDWKTSWTTSTRYKINDVVKYGGQVYVANVGHTSAATEAEGLEQDQSKWDYFHKGVEYKASWTNSTRYKVNDLVKYGAGIWICVGEHTSTANFDISNFELFSEGLEFEGNWSGATTYQPGDIIKYGGYVYVAKTVHINIAPTTSVAGAQNWDLFLTSFDFVGDWDIGTNYLVGQIVRHGGYTYYAIADGAGRRPDATGSLFWTRLNAGIRWRGEWQNSTEYLLGDTIRFNANSFICVQQHTSADDDSTGTTGDADLSPETDITGTYWNLLTAGLEESVLTNEGDMVYYSNLGPTRLPIGEEGQVLAVIGGLPAWYTWGQNEKTYYVGLNGVDSLPPSYGLSIDRPFRTIRYATEVIENGAENINAGYLLRANRTFIQKEIVEWTDYQIANSLDPFTGGFSYDKETCQRDMGLLVDAVVYDLTHGGNGKSREAALSYFTALGASYIDGQEDETVASINYGVSLMERILANLAPETNYQTENGISVGNQIKQIIDLSYTAETGSDSLVGSLAGIVTDAITAGNTDSIPVYVKPNYTIFLKTAQFDEVLPIIVPKETAIVGDELRSSRVSPAGKLIATNDKAKSVAALTHIQSITEDVITNVAVTPTSGNTETQDRTSQKAGNAGSSTAATSVANNTTEIKDIIENGLAAVDAFVTPDPTDYNTGYLVGYGDARDQLDANRDFIIAEVTAWIEDQIDNETSPFTADFTYDSAACERDVGYILDALKYDITYGGNYQTRIAADAYFSYGASTLGNGETEETLAAYARLKTVIGQVILETLVTASPNNGESQDTSGTPGSAASATFAQERIQDIIDTITNEGTLPSLIAPGTAWVSAALLEARTRLNDARATIQSDTIQYIKREYSTLLFNNATCSRDVGYIVDALGYDLMFGSNFASIKAGMSYRRGISSALVVINNQLTATLDTIDFINKKASYIVSSGAVAQADLLWADIISYVNTGTRPIIVGTNNPTTDLDQINGGKILQLNKDFLAAEATAYINATYTTEVTNSSTGTNRFTATSTSWMVAGDKIRFTSESAFGGIVVDTTYYVKEVVDGTHFTISETLDGDVLALANGSGSMDVTYYYDSARCQNDIKNYIEAIAYDLQYTGNYKSVYAARYYRNALTGSKLEDMYYVRNGCGIRNQTVINLDGSSDGNTTGQQSALYDANDYGTRRPRAGAYVSLDPGWGPNDDRAWTTNKSTYVQNVTTFGIGCVGQKIDGSIHNGGNDSIVSNDFTQVLSDGIGAWVTNLGRAELVSVFSYYNHIGYLAENGGQIRATNGNNSYGDFGSVSEGVDITETQIDGTINNRANDADVRNILIDGDRILVLEHGNAGEEYTSASYSISGTGSGVAVEGIETRDGGIYQVRLTDPGDSSIPGGTGYLTASNTAQGGSTTSITLAATDTQSSSAYVGMSIYITTGVGAGQYGYIASYNAGSKVAQIYKESVNQPGWDHVIPGTTIESSLDLTTQYTITPRIRFNDPLPSKYVRSLPSAQDWTDVAFGDAYSSYANVTTTGGNGSLCSFNVERRYGQYTATLSGVGTLYDEGDVLTIAGTLLGGTSPANDLTITLTQVNESGAIENFTTSGDAISHQYVAVGGVGDSTLDTAAISADGNTWTTVGLPASAQWSAVAYGIVNNIGTWVAIARESLEAAYSTNGVDWTSSSLNEAADWTDLVSGNGTFVAIAESDSGSTLRSISVNGGNTWSTGTIATGGAKAIAYGGGRYVIVEGNFSNQASYSANGSSWTASTLPANADSSESNWQDIAFGNNLFVAIADNDANVAVSNDGGETWTASQLPFQADWRKVEYGNGVFLALATGERGAYSQDGLTWTAIDLLVADIDIIQTEDDTVVPWDSGTLPTTSNWYDVGYGNGTYAAVAGNSIALATSTDGLSWTTRSIPTGSDDARSIAYGNGTWVVPYFSSNDTATSADGVTWTFNSNVLNNTRDWIDVEYGNGYFVTVGTGSNTVEYSTNGTSWSASTLPTFADWTKIAYGGSNFVVVSGIGSDSTTAAYSTDNGANWSAATLPTASRWSSVVYGNGRFVAIAGSSSISTNAGAYSDDGGQTWSATTLPATAFWTNISYAGGVFVITSYNSNTAYVSEDGTSWASITMDATGNWLGGASDEVDDKFVVVGFNSTATNVLGYTANTYLVTTHSTDDLSVNDLVTVVDDSAGVEIFGGLTSGQTYYVRSIESATQFTISETEGGAAIAVTDGTGSFRATVGKTFSGVGYGNPAGTSQFIALSKQGRRAIGVRVGGRARARAYVTDNRIAEIWIHEPGGGYTGVDLSTTPSLEITDPNNTGAEATYVIRTGDRVLAQPIYSNRGINYSAAAAVIEGDGYADNYQTSSFVDINNLTGIPVEGSNLRIDGIDDIYYRVVSIRNLIGTAAPYSCRVQISPAMGVQEAPEHLTDLNFRRRYSQVRLTGHDFLDIGTGNQTQTNYPDLPLQDPIPANETVDAGGGRVFYTSTDQDGNFRVGGLFNVEQSTGVATLNADAFNIAGLNELSLGSVALGGAGATVNEFSTDPFFTQDSDSVIPTQRAIKAYITSQIGGGGSSLNVNTLTAGIIFIAGQEITTTTDQQININTKMNFKGGIDGDAVVLNYFLLN